MPNSITLPVVAGNLPAGFCPTTYDAMLQGFVGVSTVSFPVGSGMNVVVSASQPASTVNTVWIKLDASGRPERTYFYAQGAWLSMHPTPPGMTMWWFRALPNFDTFDGGDATGVISDYTGHMWRQAVYPEPGGDIIAAKFPLAAGSFPSGLALNLGDAAGEENHSLTSPEMPPHTHNISLGLPISDKWAGDTSGAGKIGTGNSALNPGDETLIQNHNPFFTADSAGGNGANPPAVTPHNNVPPYIVGYLLQRTERLFYTV